MHGISEIIVVVLLTIIVIALVGLFTVFSLRMVTTTMSTAESTVNKTVTGMLAQMNILSMSLNDVIIKNTGQTDLSNSSINVLINNVPANFIVTPPVVKPNEVGTVKIYDFIKKDDEIKIGVGSILTTKKAPDPCSQAVLCLHFDEGLGNYAYDKSPFHNDGILLPTGSEPQWIDGKFSKALQFDGGDKVDITDDVTLQTDHLTIEAWVRNTGSGWRTIAAKANGTTTSAWWFGSSYDNKLLLKFNGVGGSPYEANTNLNDSLWHYVMGTYDGSFIRVYVDGKLDNIPYAHSGITNKSGILQISGNDYWGCCLWIGDIDEVRIYNKAIY